MCRNFVGYLISLITPSPSEVKGALIVVAMGVVGVAYSVYRDWRSRPVKHYRVYEGEKVRPPEVSRPPVDTGYFLYERKLYMRRKSKPRPVNVNRAGIEELINLPGIGPKLAKRIVEYRAKFGPFKKPEDLLEVKGIGPKKLQKMRPYLRF